MQLSPHNRFTFFSIPTLCLLLIILSNASSNTGTIQPGTIQYAREESQSINLASKHNQSSKSLHYHARKLRGGSNSNTLSRGSQQRPALQIKKDVDVIQKGGNSSPIEGSMLKINTMMLLFYTTLGACMPYIPIYYRHLKISGQ